VNNLPIERKKLILDLLVEGNGLRGISRATGHHRNTIVNVMHEAADGCNRMMEQLFVDLSLSDVQVDELWSFVHTKADRLPKDQRDGEKGDQFIFYGLDRRTKLVPGYVIGKRSSDTATEFMHTLRRRVVGRIQLTTDAYNGFNRAVRESFGQDVHYSQVSKTFGKGAGSMHEGYAPRIITSMLTAIMQGFPDLTIATTSHVERANLTIRQGLRRFNRLTIGFSKKLECLKSAVAVFLWAYNFRRQHVSLKGLTPAMSAGVVSVRLDWETVL
jgi:IS1 family transposase